MSEKIRVVLEFDDKGFEKGIRRANAGLSRFGKNADRFERNVSRVERSTVSWGKRLRDVTVTLASLNYLIPNLSNVLFGWQREIINANAELEQSVAIMKNFSKANTELKAEIEANSFVDAIVDKASAAPFSVQALTDSMVKLRVSGIEEVNKGFDALVDSVAAFGGTDQQLKRASIAIQQMGSKGVISMEELRQQLGEAVPKAIQFMARGLGTSYQTLVKEISKGNVMAQGAMQAMMQEMERTLGGSATRMMDTYNGVMAQIRTEATKLMRTLGGDQPGQGEGEGYFATLKEELEGVAEFMRTNEMKTFAADVGKAMKTLLTGFSDLIVMLKENFDMIASIAKGFATFYVGAKAVQAFKAVVVPTVGRLKEFRGQLRDLRGEFRNYNRDKKNMVQLERLHQKQVKLMNVELGNRKNIYTAISNQEKLVARRYAETALALQRKAAMARAASIAVGALSTAMSVIAPFAITAIAGMVYQWHESKKAIQDNIDKLLEYNGVYATSEQLKAARDRIKEIKSEGDVTAQLAEKRAKLVELEKEYQQAAKENNGIAKKGQQFRDTTDIGLQIQNTKEEIERLQELPEELAKLQASVERGIDSLARSMSESSIRRLKEGFTDATFEVQKDYEAAQEKIQKMISDGVSEAKIEEERQKAARSLLKTQLQEWKSLLAETRQSMNDLGDSAKPEEIRAQENAISFLKSKIEELKESLDDPNLQVLESVLGTKPGEGDDKANAYAIDNVNKKLLNLKGTVAGLESELNGSALSEFDKFWTSLGDKVDIPEIAKLKDEFRELYAQISELKQVKSVNKDFDSFIEKTKEAGEKARLAFGQKVSDGLSMVTKNTNKYDVTMKALIKDINEYVAVKDKQKAADMISALAQQRSVAQMMDMSEIYTEINKKSQRLAQQIGKENEDQSEYYTNLIKNAQQFLSNLDKSAEGYIKVAEATRLYIERLKKMRELQGADSALEKHTRDWGDLEKAVGDVKVNALDGFVDFFTDSLTGASASFSDFADSIIKDLTRMIVKMMVFKALSGVFGQATPAKNTSGQTGGLHGDLNMNLVDAFANGGIMTSEGRAPLKKYARGGIANSPQIAMFGEGSMPEAYVPLPDGRSIPVTMKGGSGDVEVNVINKTSQPANAEASSRFDGEKMVVDVVLKHLNQPGPMRESVKRI